MAGKRYRGGDGGSNSKNSQDLKRKTNNNKKHSRRSFKEHREDSTIEEKSECKRNPFTACPEGQAGSSIKTLHSHSGPYIAQIAH